MKTAILEALRARLTDELEVVRASAAAAREGATHEEAKPENEYDTRGLEQSYLAGAQAARAEQVAAALAWVEAFRPPALDEHGPVGVGACVRVDDGEGERCYFVSEVGGGTKLDVDGETWLVLTPSAPLGQLLVGRRKGDVVEHRVRGAPAEWEIVSVE